MIDISGIVRRLIGQRRKITRQEMADILAALAAGGLHLGNDCVSSTWSGESASADAPRIWANACTGITIISVMPCGATPHGQVRYDEPGGMHPMHHAELIFAPASLEGREYDPINYLRSHADRVLIVRDGPRLLSAAEIATESVQLTVPAWISRMRKHPEVDGVWVSVLDDGTLQLIDPNSGQSSAPREKPRHQYRVDDDGGVLHRHLPPECVGDEWMDIGAPEWEPATTPPTGGIMYDWWEAQVM